VAAISLPLFYFKISKLAKMSVLGAGWEVLRTQPEKLPLVVFPRFLFRDGVTFDLITIPVCKRHPKPALRKTRIFFDC